ncbi:DUF2332 domain-containing protein [Ideonella sp.]|uniref:DUF2332 domain-containing protein n=1 Tax=Ideonella sp. TaxID=1929293 RepID=UPI002B49AD6E|nr:DUF2332 domain-containing protein [Ideonella sp.]HJV69216.1 DUF2332 domain-containing protein [Ideonella sp.]
MRHAPDAPATLAGHLRRFAAESCAGEPLYRALAGLIAERPLLLELLNAAPPPQRGSTLLLAGLHDRLLELAERGQALPALAAYFPSVGGERLPDGALADALDDFAATELGPWRDRVATRTTQTNEAGRSAVLWPALAAIAARHGNRPLALFDFGCSAGLNLLVDRVTVDFGDEPVGAADPAAPRLACRLVGPGRPPRTPWRLATRLGVDRAPIALDDAPGLRWLRACLWPSERERAARFEQALALARAARHPVRRADDGLAVLADWLGTLPPQVTPVLFNSWVLAYFAPDELARHVERVHTLVQRYRLVWLSAEDAHRLAATTGLAATAATAEPGTSTWWALTEPDDRRGVRSSLLARSHPHGAWLEWRAG